MKFIEMTGHALMSMIEPDEVSPEKLQQVGLTDTCLVRVNEQGDAWEVVGETDTVNFRTSAPGPFILLQSSETEGPHGPHARWVSIQRDPDFTLEML